MASTVVTEDVVDPVHSPGHRVAWLVLVNVGQKLSLLAVPVYGGALVTVNLNLKIIYLTSSILNTKN